MGSSEFGGITALMTGSNGWKFIEGVEIAPRVFHAKLKTLRFPDINGYVRADYLYICEGGALKYYMNVRSVGGQDVIFYAQGEISTSAVDDMSSLSLPV